MARAEQAEFENKSQNTLLTSIAVKSTKKWAIVLGVTDFERHTMTPNKIDSKGTDIQNAYGLCNNKYR